MQFAGFVLGLGLLFVIMGLAIVGLSEIAESRWKVKPIQWLAGSGWALAVFLWASHAAPPPLTLETLVIPNEISLENYNQVKHLMEKDPYSIAVISRSGLNIVYRGIK